MSKCKGPSAVLLAGSLLLSAVGANAGGKIAIDDTKWISIGAAARGVVLDCGRQRTRR